MTPRKPRATAKAHPPSGRAGSGATDYVPSATVKRLLTIGEVAFRMHVSRNTVYSLIRCGDLPAARVGRTLRLRPEDVKRYIKRRARRRLTRERLPIPRPTRWNS